jgi:hypothetical protein
MRKKFELKITVSVSSDKGLEHIEELKEAVLSGKLQRQWIKDGKFDKVVATLQNIKDE